MRFELPTRKRTRSRLSKPLSGPGGSVHRPRVPANPPDDGRIRGIDPRRRRAGGQALPRRRRPSRITRRLVVLALLFVSLVLLTVSYRDSSAVSGAQMLVLEAVQPIERGLTRAWAPVQGAYDWTAALLRATDENPQLRRSLEEAEAKLASQRETAAENERLRDMLGLKDRGKFPNGYRQVAGRVIARSETAAANSFVIDLGTRDGISINDPVMVARGLVGRVQAVSPNAARIAVIAHREQAVSATVVGSPRGSGILTSVGNEGSPVMQLRYVSQSARVREGDLVTTSGWSSGDLKSVYPKGIPIGVVSSVGNSTSDLYKTVQVTPFANFDRIDEVFVLVPSEPVDEFIEPVEPSAEERLESARGARVEKPRTRPTRDRGESTRG